jgi:hypothetical protein
MSGGTVIAPNGTVVLTGLGRAWEVASDLVIVTALIWALPLGIALVALAANLLFDAF